MLQQLCHLRHVVIMHIATFVFKEYFVKTSHNYSTRLNGLHISVPKVSTESAKKGCYFFGAQVFNNLPSSIKETESLLIFKTLVKDFYIGNS